MYTLPIHSPPPNFSQIARLTYRLLLRHWSTCWSSSVNQVPSLQAPSCPEFPNIGVGGDHTSQWTLMFQVNLGRLPHRGTPWQRRIAPGVTHLKSEQEIVIFPTARVFWVSLLQRRILCMHQGITGGHGPFSGFSCWSSRVGGPSPRALGCEQPILNRFYVDFFALLQP